MPQLQADILGRPSFSKRTDFTPYTFTWGQTSQGIPAKFRVIHWNRAGTSNRLPYRTQQTLSHEKWDYVGVCEWSGSYDTTGWPQDLNWGHESKYGTKQFGKRFGKDLRKPETNEPTEHPGMPVHKKKRSDKPKRRSRSSGRNTKYHQ
ncbi:MAG: hypothetical protein CL699_07760 [Chloroflexi bacterium]|nr:hypothetical protein [Chloroflexota bacterium]|tara:strand:+ start:105 stop:548 length:444 start_codon:yes stop_codon:yes gene_type:complete